MNLDVTSPVRVSPRVEWYNARSERDLDRAEEMSRLLLSRRPDDEKVRRYLARLLEAEDRSADAEPEWITLRDGDADDFEAAYHVARGLMRNGGSAEEAAATAAPHANPTFRQAIVNALAHPAQPLEGEFQHIAICGVAFSGTTLLDRILGGLPGVKSTGESHWITKVWSENVYRDMNLSQPLEEARFVPCTVCGARCEVLNPAFRRALAADNENWYRKIAARLDTRVLVSADKNLPRLSEKDPLLELSALVMFKSPEQAWRSHLDKLPSDRDSEFYDSECRSYLARWANNYSAFLDHFRPVGRVIFLNFDAFAVNPGGLLPRVCERLGLPFDAVVLQKTIPGHAIGGNARAMRRLREKDYDVAIAPLPDPALEPSQAEIIVSDETTQQVWRELLKRHKALDD